MNKYTQIFIDETIEYIDSICAVLHCYRNSSHTKSSLEDSSRLAHSIKGMASFEGQLKIVPLARALQYGLAFLAGDEKRFPDLLCRLEEAVDLLRHQIKEVVEKGEATRDPEMLVQAITTQLAE